MLRQIIIGCLCLQVIPAAVYPDPTFTGETVRKELMAQKMEKVLAGTHPKLTEAKEAIERQIEYNFIKTLSGMLLAGPKMAKDQEPEIRRLLQKALMGEFDFKPVVERLPDLLRQKDSDQLSMMVQSVQIREEDSENDSDKQEQGTEEEGNRQENSASETQSETADNDQSGSTKAAETSPTTLPTTTTTKSQVDRILDAVSKISVKEISSFLKEIPEIFEGVGSIIDGVDEYFVGGF